MKTTLRTSGLALAVLALMSSARAETDTTLAIPDNVMKRVGIVKIYSPNKFGEVAIQMTADAVGDAAKRAAAVHLLTCIDWGLAPYVIDEDSVLVSEVNRFGEGGPRNCSELKELLAS